MDIRAIRTNADYKAALARADALMDVEHGTPEGEEFDVIVDLIELYEIRHCLRSPPYEYMKQRSKHV